MPLSNGLYTTSSLVDNVARQCWKVDAGWFISASPEVSEGIFQVVGNSMTNRIILLNYLTYDLDSPI